MKGIFAHIFKGVYGDTKWNIIDRGEEGGRGPSQAGGYHRRMKSWVLGCIPRHLRGNLRWTASEVWYLLYFRLILLLMRAATLGLASFQNSRVGAPGAWCQSWNGALSDKIISIHPPSTFHMTRKGVSSANIILFGRRHHPHSHRLLLALRRTHHSFLIPHLYPNATGDWRRREVWIPGTCLVREAHRDSCHPTPEDVCVVPFGAITEV